MTYAPHPLPVGSTVQFPCGVYPAPTPGLMAGELFAIVGGTVYDFGVLENHCFTGHASRRLSYDIRTSNGELVRVPYTRVRPASLLEAIAAASQRARYDGPRVGEGEVSHAP